MIFSSYDFVFVFLPLAVGVFLLFDRHVGTSASLAWIIASSLAFYAYWNYRFVALLLFSIVFNYGAGRLLQRKRSSLLLAGSIAVNLLVLGYFKYANFFLENVQALGIGGGISLHITLPLGISFITFQKIAWLVDCYRGISKETSFPRFCAFAVFFPQLIAGPIVHYKEMMPQFGRARESGQVRLDIAFGATLFVAGLAKKVLIADRLAPFANVYFGNAAQGAGGSAFDAWIGVLAYTLQLYFDFSAYSDMAAGLAVMFGVRLPLNFDSPYTARNIQDFWRRWHITLSRFLRDYLYIPLGGNRTGALHRYRNLLLTMLLGGLWHGANWTFVIWGGLHGVALAIVAFLKAKVPGFRMPMVVAVIATFLFTTFAWVWFRADNISTVMTVYSDMLGMSGFAPSQLLADPILYGRAETLVRSLFELAGLSPSWSSAAVQVLMVGSASAIALLLPNSAQFFPGGFLNPAQGNGMVRYGQDVAWRPTLLWAAAVAFVFVVCTVFMARQAPFLYFQF
jgi:alginate O-acetyltransferase complex protein AlgI